MRRLNLPTLPSRNDAERISRTWNAFAGDDEIAGGSAEDVLVHAIARLHARDDAPHVDSAFAGRLLHELNAHHPATTPGTDQRISRDKSRTMQQILAGASQAPGWTRRSPRLNPDGTPGARRSSALADLIAIAAVILLIFTTLIGDRANSLFDRRGYEPSRQLAASSPTTDAASGAPATAMYRGDAGRTGAMPGPGPIGQPTLAWKKPIEEGLSEVLVSANNRVYATAFSPRTQTFDLIAVDLETGDDEWRASIDLDHTSVPAVANGMVYVTTTTGLTAVDEATGDVVWRYPGGETGMYSTPLVDEGVVYMASSDYAMQAVDAVTGERVWHVRLPDTPSLEGNSWGSTSIAIADGMVFGRGNDGLVFALDMSNGDLVWETTLEGGAIEPFLVADGVLAVTAIDFSQTEGPRPVRLHALDAATGDPMWEPVELTSPSTLAAADGALFVADSLEETGTLNAFNILTGEPLWTWQGQGPLGSPAIVDGSLYIAARGDGTIHRIDVATGKSDWAVTLGSVNDPLVIEGMLLVTGYGAIYAVAGGAEQVTLAPNEEPVDLSGLPPCEPPRAAPSEPLMGEPAATIDVETRLIEPIGNPPTTIDGRPVEITTWPQMLTANLPAGERASVEQMAGVRATLSKMGDCSVRPEGADHIPGFFSDDFFRRGIVTPDPDGYELTWSMQPDEDEMERLEVFHLDDGRVAASMVSDSGSGIFLVFVEADGAWLIDEFYEVRPDYFEGPLG